jgi:hypothetical protein
MGRVQAFNGSAAYHSDKEASTASMRCLRKDIIKVTLRGNLGLILTTSRIGSYGLLYSKTKWDGRGRGGEGLEQPWNHRTCIVGSMKGYIACALTTSWLCD